ncbi:MAG TPA: polysaccharide deacetylase family protein [Bacillales bacterium]|nr:polysaccharide deacetylase family protein [Bacillales bacterium]
MYDWQDDRVIVRNEEPEVLLTFDDGPTAYLPEMLSVLREKRVQALFFWQSSLLNQDDIPWRQVIDEGHLIGNHAHSHPKLPELSYDEQFEEIGKSKERLERLTGREITRFRPPFGLYNEDTMEIAKKLGLEVVLWQVASWDWKLKENKSQIIENVREHTESGDIVLLHELPQTVKVLPELIDQLRKKGHALSRPHSHLTLKGK